MPPALAVAEAVYRDEVVIAYIEKQWLSRAHAQQLGKPQSMKYRRAEIEFFCGAMTALQAMQDPSEGQENKLSSLVPPYWVVNVMSGRNVVEVSK